MKLDKSSSSEEIQKLVFSIGKENNFQNLRDWLKAYTKYYSVRVKVQEWAHLSHFMELKKLKI